MKKTTLRMAFGGAFGTIPSGVSVGGLRAMNDRDDALRRDATSRYGIDAQSATARMGDATSRYGIDAQSANARLGADTQRYGYDTSAASHRYGVDAQSATARMTDATQRFGIGTQADTSKYGFDASKAASMYGADASKAASMYGADASKAASKYGADASMYNAGLGAQASNFAATTGANASMHNAGLGANASMYNAGLGALASNFAATTGANASMYNAGLGANASMHNAGLAAQSNNFGAITQANASMHNAGLAAQANNYSADSNLLGNMWHMKNGGEVPVRVGLRNGGEIRAMDGFSERSGATGSFASQAGNIKWLSPKDAIEFSAKMQAVDDAHALQQAQLSAAGGGIHDRGIGGAGVQSPGAQLAQQQANQRWGWEQQDRAYAMQNRPLEMQERQRLTGRRNMYDAALAGHFGAGGFGGKMVGAMPVRPQPGFGLPQHSFGLRDGGEINARWGFSDGNIVYKTPLLQAKEDAELAEYEARRKNVEAPRLRDGGEIHANMGYEYLVPDNPERTPGWVQEFNAKGRGAYVGRDKAKANEYAVAKRNAETTDRMASGGAYPGAVSLDAQRNPYKRVTDLENMYDDTGYNPYTGISDPSKKGWGAQWVATSKYRLRDGGDMLQTGMGGDVPGTGKGDKVPAKYEPGEFVVSNDMLDAQPGLRDHLRTLREQVLADKGMTVQEADAKAVGKGRGLRASEGADGEVLKQRRMRDFNLTAADYGAIEGGLQAKERRGENIRNALGKNDGFAKLATLNQQAANADAKVQADAARGIYRDVEPTASPELTQKIDDGRRSDLRGYVDAQSMRDPGGALPAVPKSLRDTGNIYKTVDALGRTTYSGGNVKEGAKFIGNDGNEFTPKGKVEYAKPGEPVGMFPGGGGVVFTPRSSDPAQRTEDIATAKANAAAFRAQQAAQDAEESRAYHEAGMAGNREIAKNQSLRDIDARVKSAQHVLSSRTTTDGEKAAALKIVDDAGSMLQGVERSYAEGETNRARDAAQSATTIRAEELRSQADMARAQAPLRAAEAQRQRDAAIWAAAGGDPVKASQLAAQAGLDPKKYTDMVSTAQGQVKARNDIESSTQKLIRDRIAGTLPSSGDPKADEAFADRIANTIVTNNPKVARLNPEQLAEVLPELRARATLLERFRNPQESGYESWVPDAIAGRSAPDRMSQLPPTEFFKGAKLEEKASGLRGALTFGGLEKGDFVLNLPGYKNMNLGKLDDTERNELMKLINAANGGAK